MKCEKRFSLVEKDAFRKCENNLMDVKEQERKGESAYGMLCVDTSADRGSKISDEGLRYSVKTDGIIVAESVLGDTDKRSE